MLTDPKIQKKLAHIERNYEALRFEAVADVPMEMAVTQAHFRSEPTARAGLKWRPAKPGVRWGDEGQTAWLRGKARLPKALDGKRVFVHARTGCETLLLVNGEHRGVFDPNHTHVCLAARARAGRVYRIALEAYAGHFIPRPFPVGEAIRVEPDSRVFRGVSLTVEREDVSAFVFDLRVLRQLADVLDANSLRRNRVAAGLAEVWRTVDALPEETGEASWRPKLAQARQVMKPLLAAVNGTTAPMFGLTGHSHIDTAWKWTLAETWRKCARTFSSVLNLLEQYPEFRFVQSQPCQTEKMREFYPTLFERIKRMVRANRWEPNGAMWVEPDCNVPSGESFVRQLLVGQQATREMFGYTSDTLWLPDVFGYSAALPQILKKAGVDYFCTTKIAWNDTTRFPYDTFWWQGIDGTKMAAHYNTIHAWPDPATLDGRWKWVQHKDVQDRSLMSFGFGDGGGGPQAEMVEVARRVQDLEGCPRTQWTSVSEFMQGVERDLGDRLPTWVGELYLEYHRGTLTSIARIKRGNRKAEFALREAEWLATLTALGGGAYPADELLAIWKEVLTNQFHDILPGSSIAQVNDEAIASYEQCVARAAKLANKAIAHLLPEGPATVAGASAPAGADRAVNPPEAPLGLLVANSLSWERTGELVLDDAPAGCRPAEADLAGQWVTDVEGSRKLAVIGLTVPALGTAVLPLAKGRTRGSSPFKVTGRTVRTPHATVRFDKAGRIVSLVDKSARREVVRPGGALGVLWLGEDVPLNYDNWDIDREQSLKMRPETRLTSHEVVADGPVQLRIRQEYDLGAGSRLVRDVVFHAATARVDFETVVDWREQHKLLKVGFELDVHAEAARHEIQYGHLLRPTHENLPQDRARFEVCAHKWTDLSEPGFGVALLNDCKYGVSVLGGDVRLTLLKSGLYPDARADAGRHAMTVALMPHAGPFSVQSVVRPAYELNAAPTTIACGPETSAFAGLLAVDAPSVIVESVKWAESGNAFVVRLYEAGGATADAAVRLNVPVRRVTEVNLLEEDAKPLKLARNAVKLRLTPFDIRTLRCEV